jgi:ribosome modulation factor
VLDDVEGLCTTGEHRPPGLEHAQQRGAMVGLGGRSLEVAAGARTTMDHQGESHDC